jgi:translation elongation factor EF-Ts
MNERQEYIDKLAAQLKEWDNEIEKLQAKVKHASQDVKEKYQAEMANIIEKRDAAKSKLTEIQQSTLEAWQRIETRIGKQLV